MSLREKDQAMPKRATVKINRLMFSRQICRSPAQSEAQFVQQSAHIAPGSTTDNRFDPLIAPKIPHRWDPSAGLALDLVKR